MSIQIDQNLSWLQDFYKNKIYPMQSSLPLTVTDEQIMNNYKFRMIPTMPGLLKIYTLGNPGWSLNFSYSSTIYEYNNWNRVSVDLNRYNDWKEADYDSEWVPYDDRYVNEWLSINNKDTIFYAAGGPLYLNIILESFKCWVENLPFSVNDDNLIALRDRIKIHNPLITWLEKFFLICCDGDWKYSYGYRLISTASDWVAAFSVAELELENKPFEHVIIQEPEGTVECYKKDSQIILRTHHRGLITGISIFKDWVES